MNEEKRYVVEFLSYDGTWNKSTNVGIQTAGYDTFERAETDLKAFADRPARGFPGVYRVRDRRPEPVRVEYRWQEPTGGGWIRQ
jgi:hypothetical protein